MASILQNNIYNNIYTHTLALHLQYKLWLVDLNYRIQSMPNTKDIIDI